MNLSIEQESELFLCYDIAQNWLQHLSYNISDYLINHVAARDWPEFFKGGKVLFLKDESQECGV